MRAAGYVRVSTVEQAENGLNLREDRERIREKCEAEGWELIEVFEDAGMQGDDPDRPGLAALLDSLAGVDVVVLRSIERLARDPMILGLATNTFRAAGVRVESFVTGPIDIETPQGEFTSSLFAAIGKFEKRLTGQRVKQAMAARVRSGDLPGGHAPFGYAWAEKRLAIDPRAAQIVRRIFGEYATGVGQRGIVRALNEDGVPSATGGRWTQSAISRTLARAAYVGKLEVKDADGNLELLEGRHEAIIDNDLWSRVQAIRSGADGRKGGRQPEGKHLLTRGLLRCKCGSAMIPRKARPGIERERYVCAGRLADPSSCSQQSIRRELIDAPLLAAVLTDYVDIEATRKRIEGRMTSALTSARQAVVEADRELAVNEGRTAKVKRGWQDEVIGDDEYAAQSAELTAEREAAQQALRQAVSRVQEIEQAGTQGDAEQALLDHLAQLKRAAATTTGQAPDLSALRNVLGDLFDRVQLVKGDDLSPLATYDGDGLAPLDELPRAGDGYSLVPIVRGSALDAELEPVPREMPTPIGQATPVPVAQSYPPGFFARYCWW
jgi:site-specific DNA recombinase